MARFKRRNIGGGGGGSGAMGGNMVGVLSQVIGGALMLFALILFQIAKSSIILKNASFLEKRHPTCKLVLMFRAAAPPLFPASSPLI